MNYISDRDYNAQMKAIKRMNQSKEREMKLREEREKYSFKFKMPSTSKIVLFVSLIICLQIIFFCERLMVELKDTSALYVLLGIPAAMTPIIWAYFSKAKAENTKNGIVYETAMRNKDDSVSEQLDDAPNDPSF